MSELRSVLVAMAFVLLGPPVAAQSQPAYAAKDAHLRAGPARDYPVVAVLPQGVELLVQGCLPDYSWCDVLVGPQRGWMYAANINYAWQGAYVPLLDYGAQIGIAVLDFSLLDYWGSFYVDRPFYRDRDRWSHRPRPPRSPGAAQIRPVPPSLPPGVARQAPAPIAGPGSARPEPPQRGSPGQPRPVPAVPPPQNAPRRGPHERESPGGQPAPGRQGNGR